MITESISFDFRLSFEDWLDSRDIREADQKSLKRYQADYLLFNAEPRWFSANEQGWSYTSSTGKSFCDWADLVGVAYRQRVITLMAANGHYHLPLSALGPSHLAALTRWLNLAMDEPEMTDL
jgi:hypothetical protein